MVENLHSMQETWIQSQGQEEIATEKTKQTKNFRMRFSKLLFMDIKNRKPLFGIDKDDCNDHIQIN